jgi:hypothetical protein
VSTTQASGQNPFAPSHQRPAPPSGPMASRAVQVTAQVPVIVETRLPFAITHAPGHMFATDVPDTDLRTGR